MGMTLFGKRHFAPRLGASEGIQEALGIPIIDVKLQEFRSHRLGD